MADVAYYTKEGLDQLKQKLNYLKTQRRKEVADAIASAREQGDLRENAEYDAAKEEQGKLESEIAQLEETLANARLIDESEIDTSKAYILSTVRVLNKKMNKEFTYTLVSPEEADLKSGKISTESPIGKALLGHGVGDTVTVEAPAGKMDLEILEIKR